MKIKHKFICLFLALIMTLSPLVQTYAACPGPPCPPPDCSNEQTDVASARQAVWDQCNVVRDLGEQVAEYSDKAAEAAGHLAIAKGVHGSLELALSRAIVRGALRTIRLLRGLLIASAVEVAYYSAKVAYYTTQMLVKRQQLRSAQRTLAALEADLKDKKAALEACLNCE